MKYRNIEKLYEQSEHVESSCSRAKNIEDSYILKMCKSNDFAPSDLKKEIYFAKRADKHGVGPKINNYGFYNKIGFIEMEKMKFSLKKIMEDDKITNFHLKSLKKVLKKMWKRGNFIHMDLHAENIWFNNKNQAKLIDFGIVEEYCTKEDTVKAKNDLISSSYDIHSLIEFLLPTSKKKEELLKLKEIMSGTWM
jgi:serine/threonine protein kinase